MGDRVVLFYAAGNRDPGVFELLAKVPDLECDAPVYLAGNVMQAITSMPCRLNL